MTESNGGQTPGVESGAQPISGFSSAPVYAAGVMVAGGLLFAGWGVVNAAMDGEGIFANDTAVVETVDGGGSQDDSVTLPKDEYDALLKSAEGSGDEGEGAKNSDSEDAARKEEDADPIVYQIVWGDTLSQISYDTGVSIGRLVELNHIENPDLIYAGATLLIPQD